MQAEFINGMSAIADRFEGFVLDQWGVLHNGSKPYPGAIELLAELQRRNKRLVVLSNSGRRAQENLPNLARLGFNPQSFANIVTSGEVCWQALHDRSQGLLRGLGRRCLLIAREGDTTPVAGLDLELVERPEDADFIFLSWLEHSQAKRALMEDVLQKGPGLGVSMICANPDRVAPVEGGLIEAPGSAAARYEAEGGKVIYIGKPHMPIYTAVLNAFEDYAKEEIVCVGDSLEHDIQGANRAGLASCLIAGGIHEAELGGDQPKVRRMQVLENLIKSLGGRPDFVAPSFSW